MASEVPKLGRYDGIKLVSLEGVTDVAVDGKLDSLLLGYIIGLIDGLKIKHKKLLN